MAESLRPWTGRERVQLNGVPPSARVHEVLDTCFWKLRTSNPGLDEAELLRDAWCHVSQGVERLPVTRPMGPCLLSNSCLYSFQKDVVLSGHGHMKVIGWPDEYLSDVVGDSDYLDIAGNSFSYPLACVLSTAAVMNRYGAWWGH